MSDNPYETPSADVESVQQLGELSEPKSVSSGRGWGWIADGFGYFKKSVGGWILACIVFFVIMMVISLIPLIGQIGLMLTSYVWIAGFMLGARAQDESKPMGVNYLFAGFSHNTGKLILLSLLASVVSIVVMLAAIGPVFFSMATGDPSAAEGMFSDPTKFLLPFLIAMLVQIPLMMALWFAPALIVLNDVSIPQALKMSFFGCLKNILPFLIFGILSFVLMFVAMIPIFLGLLVFFPTMISSMYVAYKDIFLKN